MLRRSSRIIPQRIHGVVFILVLFLFWSSSLLPWKRILLIQSSFSSPPSQTQPTYDISLPLHLVDVTLSVYPSLHIISMLDQILEVFLQIQLTGFLLQYVPRFAFDTTEIDLAQKWCSNLFLYVYSFHSYARSRIKQYLTHRH